MPAQVQLFIELLCALLCTNNYTAMCIFRCNSIVPLSAPFISIANSPSCASLYRSQNTPLNVPSDEPLVTSSIALTSALQVHHQVQRQVHPFCHLLVHLHWLFKVNSDVHLQV